MEESAVALVDLTHENYTSVVVLCVSPEQEKFVGTVAEAIADAHFHGTYEMRAIALRRSGAYVGFVMFEMLDHDKTLILHRILVDCHHQGKGYGRDALHELIALAKQQCAQSIRLTTSAENAKALRMYHSAGFRFAQREDQKLDGKMMVV